MKNLLLTAFVLMCVFNLFGNSKPNIVFILADDLGWSDCELYNTTNYYKTPHIKRLASKGMTFTRAYTSSPVCSPTRSSIMTGQNPARTGITHARCHLPMVRMKPNVVDSMPSHRRALEVNYVTRLDTSYYTLAEMLKDNGYATGHFGKWHLGLEPYHASNHGFDVAIPKHPEGAISSGYMAPWKKLKDHDFKGKPGEHIEDRMAQEAVKFMRKHKSEPFFLNYWAFSIHSPWSAKKELTQQYAQKIDPLFPHRNPVYAAMIHSFDEAVGTIINEIEKLGIADNTIIILYSDNGGNIYPPAKTEPKGWEHIPGTNSYPLRAGKGSYYEGGIRVPMVVVWPGKTEAGSRTNELVISDDWYPTLLDMLNIAPQANQIFDGQSFKQVLLNQTYEPKPKFGYRPLYIFNSTIPAMWVHHGDWKLIRFFCDNADQSDRFELYNLTWDISESYNLSHRFPKKTSELNAILDSFIIETNCVIPKPNPDYQCK